jgi:hypothetical protein
MNKRGDNQYISWILIFGVVVALSYVLFNWSVQQATDAKEQLEEQSDPIVCSETGISVSGSCQDEHSIKFNLTNTENKEVVGLLIRMVSLYPEEKQPEDMVLMRSISAGFSERISILSGDTVQQIKVIPIVYRDERKITCEEKAVVREVSFLRQC